MSLVGKLLSERYRLEAEIGQGGMGTVFRAHDVLLDREVAIKLLANPAYAGQGNLRLMREAQAAARLHHPNIVTVYDVGEEGGYPYIVMEYVEGAPLRIQGRRTIPEVLELIRQLCQALEHAHSMGIIHRDLKPENILISSAGDLKLMDFGLARSALSARITMEGSILGTPLYLSPEQILGKAVDQRADLYALGVIFYELITETVPFADEDLLALFSRHVHDPPAPPRSRRPDIPVELDSIILKLLEKDPEKRFGSAAELERALAPFMARVNRPDRLVPIQNLPVQLTSFVGRVEAIREIRRLLSDHRLVTLTGPGGSGKTRLGIEVAREEQASYSNGVYFVELASLSDAELIPQTVMSNLEVRERPDEPLLSTLIEYLSQRNTLLVLDNCEHLIGACADLAEKLLRSCECVHMIVTSREALGIAGELIFPVAPLALPENSDDLSIESIGRVEATRLFLERALSVKVDFSPSDSEAAYILQICRRLDGIPLAIELAAARVKVLSVQQIAGRLDDRFHLLTGGSRTALSRHQTLQATMDWSYNLLPDREQKLFRRLAVFVGGWTLEAAEAVCGGADIHPGEVLDLLAQLVNKSLIVFEEEMGEARYHRLETIRQYALQKLLDSGEINDLRNRHLEYFMAQAEQAEVQLNGPEEVEWLAHLEADHDNFRAALDWTQFSPQLSEIGLRLGGALAAFWLKRGYLWEGRERLSSLLLKSTITEPNAWRAKALFGAASLAYLQSDYVASRALWEESQAGYRALGSEGQSGIAFCLIGLANVATEEGDYETSPRMFEEALAISQSIGNKRGIGEALRNLGWAAMRPGDYTLAAQRLHEALPIFKEIGDINGISSTLSGLGEMAVRTGDYDGAIGYLKESLELRQKIGNKWGMAATLGTIGWAALLQGKLRQAAQALSESLEIRRDIGDIGGMAWCLERFADIAIDSLRIPEAVRLLGKAAGLRASVGSVIDPADQPEHEVRLESLRRNLGETKFNQLWDAGRHAPLQEEIDEALSLSEQLPDR